MAVKVVVEIADRQVLAVLQRLADVGHNLGGALRAIGENLVESTKRRFETSTGPDGEPWAPNTQTTYEMYLGAFKSSTTKKGRLSKAGASRAAGKKPLIGETQSLMSEIVYLVSGDELIVGSPMEYATTHQFGAAEGEFGSDRHGRPIPWGDIPARPFLGLDDEDRRMVLDVLSQAIEQVVERANA